MDEYSDEEEYSDEDVISEAELEEPTKPEQNLINEIVAEKIVPQTYEQLKAMYKAQVPENETPEPPEEINEDLRSEQLTDYHEDEEDIEEDYDVDESEEEEDEDENDEELEDDEEISDVDDNELMKRLESRYGRLPQPESDEDHEEETWTSNKLELENGATLF